MTKLRVKEICKQKGLTMGQIAERLGISPVNLSNSLNGNPTLNRLQEVANILGVSIGELFVNEDKSHIFGYIEVNGQINKIESLQSLSELFNTLNK